MENVNSKLEQEEIKWKQKLRNVRYDTLDWKNMVNSFLHAKGTEGIFVIADFPVGIFAREKTTYTCRVWNFYKKHT